MNYLGNFAEQDIYLGDGYKTLYAYTNPQNREVILYYTLEEECYVLKQIAICSEITISYTMFWVFEYEYIERIINIDDFKKHCLQIVEEEIIPYIQNHISRQ